MIKKRCTDCKYTRGIGYDFWCGEGHTKYEVFGAETNCPYFEYHDWSKGTPSRTEKRFKTNEVGCIVDYYDNNLKNYDGQEIVDLLNALHEENQALKQSDNISDLETEIIKLREENEKLRAQIDIILTMIKLAVEEEVLKSMKGEKMYPLDSEGINYRS